MLFFVLFSEYEQQSLTDLTTSFCFIVFFGLAVATMARTYKVVLL